MLEAKEDCKREAKHVELDHAVHRVIGAVTVAESLLNQIIGTGNPETCDKVKPPSPSLSGVLSEAPPALLEEAARLEKIIAEIRQQIF